MRSFEVTRTETPKTEPQKPRAKSSLIDSPHPIKMSVFFFPKFLEGFNFDIVSNFFSIKSVYLCQSVYLSKIHLLIPLSSCFSSVQPYPQIIAVPQLCLSVCSALARKRLCLYPNRHQSCLSVCLVMITKGLFNHPQPFK